MTTRRAALPELSAYHTRERAPFPWAAINWQAVAFGAGLGVLACLLLALGIVAGMR